MLTCEFEAMDSVQIEPSAVVAVRMTMKIGEPLTDCRLIHKQPIELTMTCEEGLGVLLAKISARVSAHDAIVWTESNGVYLKPGAQSKQREYVQLRADRFTDQVHLLWKSARRRKIALADFVVDLYVYVSKVAVGGTQLRRATGSQVQQASQEVSRFLEATPAAQRPHPSSLAFRYFTTQHARQPDGSTPELPAHATFWQLQALDRSIETANQHQAITERAHSSAYKTIRVRINGGDVNFDFNMSGLRDTLGLPDFDLRLPTVVDTAIADLQGEDMEEIDHMNTL